MQKITPFLWFDGRAEEAMNFYTSVFRNSKIVNMSRYGKGAPSGLEGTVMMGTITLDGQDFMLLNGGPVFSFTPAVSFFINCETQEEIDYFWGRLLEGGEESRCGWLKDKFGLSWQVVPAILGSLLNGSDAAGAQRAMEAMLKMGKLDMQILQDAYDGK